MGPWRARAVGGGIGGGVYAADNSDNWPAIPAGIVGGALIGGIDRVPDVPTATAAASTATAATTTASAAAASAAAGEDHPAWRAL